MGRCCIWSWRTAEDPGGLRSEEFWEDRDAVFWDETG